ncbi:MAG: aldo/keto reductase [Chloroflexota bacterium]
MKSDISGSQNLLHDIELGLGAWSWGDRTVWNYGKNYSDDDIEAGFTISINNGITFVDTAEVYGNGRSERLLGKFLKNSTGIVVATKFFPLPWRFTKSSVVNALKNSLERLDIKQVDLYQIHWPSPIIPIETYAEGLAMVIEQGLARAVGVSNYNKHQMQRAYTVLSKYGIPLTSNQVEYNLLNRSVEKDGLLTRCQELDIKLIAYSPLAMGLLTGKYNPENPPPGVRSVKYSSMLKEIQPLIKLLKSIGQDLGGKSAAQVALNWCICKGSLPIPGAKNTAQAEMNAGAIGWRLNAEQIQSLDDASEIFTK